MKRISLFATYVLMNVFLVLILVSAFTYIIYTNAYRQVSEEMETMQETSLTQAMQNIDKHLKRFYRNVRICLYRLRINALSAPVGVLGFRFRTAPPWNLYGPAESVSNIHLY